MDVILVINYDDARIGVRYEQSRRFETRKYQQKSRCVYCTKYVYYIHYVITITNIKLLSIFYTLCNYYY